MNVLLDEEYRNELLNHLCNAIKQVQMEQLSKAEEMLSKDSLVTFTNESPSVGILCSSLEMIFSYRLKNRQAGWWECVRNFCRRDLIRKINQLQNVKTNAGKSRAWLFITLNEKDLEGYLQSFQIDRKCMQNYYDQYAMVCGSQVSAIQTLISGLDSIVFNLSPDMRYLDFRISSFPLHYDKTSTAKIHIADRNRGSVVHIDTSTLTTLATRSGQKAVGFVKQMLNSDLDINATPSGTSLSKRENLKIQNEGILFANGCRNCRNKLICLCPSDAIASPSPSGYTSDAQQVRPPFSSHLQEPFVDLLTEDIQFPLPVSRSLGRDRYNPFNGLNDQDLAQKSKGSPDKMQRFDAQIQIKDAPIKVRRRHKRHTKSKGRLSDSGSDRSSSVSEESLQNKNLDCVFQEEKEEILSSDPVLINQMHPANISQDTHFEKGEEVCQSEDNANETCAEDSPRMPSIVTQTSSQNGNIHGNSTVEVKQDHDTSSELFFSSSSSEGHVLFDVVSETGIEESHEENTETVNDQELSEIEEPLDLTGNILQSPATLFVDNAQNDKDTADTNIQYVDGSEFTKKESGKDDSSSECVIEVEAVDLLPIVTYDGEENSKTFNNQLKNSALGQDVLEDVPLGSYETKDDHFISCHQRERESVSVSLALEGSSQSNSEEEVEPKADDNSCIELDNRNQSDHNLESSFDTKPELKNEQKKHRCAPDIDNTLRLYLLLEILHDESESILRFFHVSTGHSEGNWSPLFLLFTDCFLYFLVNGSGKCPYQVLYSASYAHIDHISIGYNAQNMLHVFYNTELSSAASDNSTSKQRIKLLIDTADHLLTNLITSAMSEAFSLYAKQNGVVKVCPAIFHDAKDHQISLEKCLQCEGLSNDIKFYQLVHWEDPEGFNDSLSAKINLEGFLSFKVSSLLRSSWKEAFFVLHSGTLYRYQDKESTKPEMMYDLRANNCTGCKRSRSSSGLSFELTFRDKRKLELMGENNDQVTEWLQSLCLIVSLDMVKKPESAIEHLNNDMLVSCSLIVADEHVVLCHEDSHTGFIRSLTTIPSSSLFKVSVDESDERVCEMFYENNSSGTSKCTIYFPNSYCLQGFKSSINTFHKIPVLAKLNSSTQQRCREALALLDSRWTRANSLLKGREL